MKHIITSLSLLACISFGTSAFAQTATPVSSSVANTCVAANFTDAKYKAIKVGMTMDQVNQTIGCKSKPGYITRYPEYTSYGWSVSDPIHLSIIVKFDTEVTKVKSTAGIFKDANGF